MKRKPFDVFVPRLGTEDVQAAQRRLQEYKTGRRSLEQRLIENEEWYRLRHWNRMASRETDPQPASGWLLSGLMSKHADLMDNQPTAAILPREESDTAAAELLSRVVPVVLDRAEFGAVYDAAAWDKVKNGTACYGVFWDSAASNGRGEIALRRIDLLGLFWEPTVSDLQDSREVFYCSLADRDSVRERWPEAKLAADSTGLLERYRQEDTVDLSGKVLLVDWYYKRNGKLHFAQFSGESLLYATENDERFAENGLYEHGRFPFVLDVLLPQCGSPAGFGLIDIMRDPQRYIDRLDQVILRNAALSGRPRWFYRDTCGVNEEEFADWNRDFVHVAGRLEEGDLRQITIQPLPAYIVNHRAAKIQELKETAANRDVSNGGTAAGVTAAAAIAAMQEAGNKVSRDMLKGTYRAYRQVVELVIELIGQFYDEARTFRITASNETASFLTLSNAGLRPLHGRQTVYDIAVTPQKSNPFNRLSQNEFAKELYQMGVFRPENSAEALAMLDLMEFEGKERLEARLRQSGGAGEAPTIPNGRKRTALPLAAALSEGAAQARLERGSPL